MIGVALLALAEAEERPRLKALLLELRAEVRASVDGGCLRPARANFVFRRADDYWRRRWDAVSAQPLPQYEAQLEVINRMYWSRRVIFEWRYPGRWDVALSV